MSTINPSRTSVDLDSSMLNNSIGAPIPKSNSSDMNKTPTTGMSSFILPEWVHCEICKRREFNGTNHTRLTLGYCHPCGHIICRDCAMKIVNNTCLLCSKSTQIFLINSNLPSQIKVLFISRYDLVHLTETQVREQISKLYANMYKQLFDVFEYQDMKWNQLMMHRIEYLKQMNKIKKGFMELEEMKRINKELYKIFQEQDQYFQTDAQRYRQYSSNIMPSSRPSSVASSTSLNFGRNPAIIKPLNIGTSSSVQHVPPPEPDKLMTYEQAMIYAHPALKDALRLAHRRKMSSKNSGPLNSK